MRRSDVQRREGYLDSFALHELSDAVRKSHWSAPPPQGARWSDSFSPAHAHTGHKVPPPRRRDQGDFSRRLEGVGRRDRASSQKGGLKIRPVTPDMPIASMAALNSS